MSGPLPAVAAARQAVRAVLAEQRAASPGGTAADPLVLVACSGGPDSLALAAVTAWVVARDGGRAGAVVVDHGLQAGSAEVAARTAATCRTLGLDPVVVETVTTADRPGGPEGRAREARYAAIDAAARRLGAAAVLLGHTLDDQAETVLLGLARGSGARSLAGMHPVRGLLRRPFLGLRRADTLAVCAAAGLEPWHDPTNAGDDPEHPLRSRLRRTAMPVLEDVLGPGLAASHARTADLLRDDDDALTALALDLLAAATVGGGELDTATLAAAQPALRRRALRAAALAAGVPGGSLRRDQLAALEALVADWHGQGPVDLPGGRVASRRCGRLSFCIRRGPGTGPARRAARGDR